MKWVAIVINNKSLLNCVPYVLTCQRVLRAYVLPCQRVLRAYVLTCQRVLRAYVLMCQHVLHAYVLMCLRTLRAHMPTCLLCLHACVLTCLEFLASHGLLDNVIICQYVLPDQKVALMPHLSVSWRLLLKLYTLMVRFDKLMNIFPK